MIGSRLGHYEILDRLGEGGMGEVWRARDTRLGREIALKILPPVFTADPERVARFTREAQVLAALNHPHIAQIYGFEEVVADPEGPARVQALAMELVDGETLAERIASGPMPVDEVLRVARQIAEALEAAHEKGIVHRDLKPANIKLRSDGTVKVLDFGLAKLTGVSGSVEAGPSLSQSPTLTSPALITGVSVLLGTAAYMSPEQAKGRAADARSDIWAFGVVVYEMLTARRTFAGDTMTETLASVIRDQPPLETLPARIRPLIERCLEKDPRLRLQAIGEARIALERSLDPVSRASVAAPIERRRSGWLPWAIAAIALAAALVATGLVFARRPEPPLTTRYTITGPDDSILQSFALSPDGRYVAIAANVAGRRQLWLRPLDSYQLRAVAGTDDGAFPFWSPGGDQIAFFAQGKLKKIALSGGPAQTVCEVPDSAAGRAGAWTRDGNILFALPGSASGGGNAVIRRVPAGGGSPVNVLETTRPARAVVPLPDGRRFLYTSSDDGGSNSALFVASVDGRENRQILTNVLFATYAPAQRTRDSGHLLFVREETLMAQPFDPASGSVAGDAVPLAEGVLIPARGPYTPVTASNNGVMAYVRNADNEAPTHLVFMDRLGNTSELSGVLGAGPTLSPDGRSLAYLRYPNGRTQTWVRNLTTGREIRLTADESRNTTPLWSPDGQRIVFRSERGGKAGDLYSRSANGAGKDEPLLATPRNKIPTQWSRDGKYVVYSEGGARSFGLWVVGVTSEPGRTVAQTPMPFLADDSDPAHGQLSPDSRWMAYVAREGGRQEVFVRPFPAVGDYLWKISTGGGVQPRWRGDGRELYFVALDGRMMAVPVHVADAPTAQKTTPSFEAGLPVPLFETHIVSGASSRAYQYDVSADGSRFVVATTGIVTAPVLNVEVNWNTNTTR